MASGARLGGTGRVGNANVGTGAFLAPGNSPGTLYATTLVLGPGSTFDWEVQNATDQSNGFDKINLTGNLDLSGVAPGQKITFRIISRLGAGDGNQSGNPLNFDPPGIAAQPTTFNFGVVGGLTLNAGTTNISDVFQFDLSQFTYSNGRSFERRPLVDRLQCRRGLVDRRARALDLRLRHGRPGPRRRRDSTPSEDVRRNRKRKLSRSAQLIS